MLNELARSIHANAMRQGFWDIPGNETALLMWCDDAIRQEKLLRIVTEVAELAELYRNETHGKPCDKVPELTNEEEECADIFIRLLDFTHQRQIDLDKAVRLKREYNTTRPFLHGKKF